MSNTGDFNLWTVLGDIEWRDPLLIGIILFHIAVTMMALMTRNHGNFQLILFLTLLLLVYFSENLNEMASHHWKLLSRQQYFDSKGMFISLIFSVPILLNCMVMMASWLWESSQLMVQLKSAQLKQRKKRTSQELECQGDSTKDKTS
uniref:Transmembrane protein 18 n=1 Tax=Lygus hesperus TaxID=30085 RepID=A0A0A9XFQ8_LYGHE